MSEGSHPSVHFRCAHLCWHEIKAASLCSKKLGQGLFRRGKRWLSGGCVRFRGMRVRNREAFRILDGVWTCHTHASRRSEVAAARGRVAAARTSVVALVLGWARDLDVLTHRSDPQVLIHDQLQSAMQAGCAQIRRMLASARVRARMLDLESANGLMRNTRQQAARRTCGFLRARRYREVIADC